MLVAGTAAIFQFLELAYPIRLPGSTEVSLTPVTANTLDTPFTALSPTPTVDSDGLARAILPLTGSRGFLRLEATITP